MLPPHSRLGDGFAFLSVGESTHGYMLKQLSLQEHDLTEWLKPHDNRVSV